MKQSVSLALVAAIFIAVIFWLKPVRHAPGVLVPGEPEQTAVASADAPPFEKDGWALQPLARYDITARLLHKKRYYSDAVAGIAPYDFAVGWGRMSDQAILDRLSISQGNRFFFWQYADTPPMPIEEIISHAANMHLIPADFRVRMQLWRASAGDLIRLRGWLVEGTRGNLPAWRSSLIRTDDGNGACEIMWVESCEKAP